MSGNHADHTKGPTMYLAPDRLSTLVEHYTYAVKESLPEDMSWETKEEAADEAEAEIVEKLIAAAHDIMSNTLTD
jgi:hypothetical protein